MVVRIRFPDGPKLIQKGHKNRHVALAVAVLLTPSAITALALGFWRVAADLRIAGQFFITDGLFSHWQVWMALAALIQSVAVVLNRYGNRETLFEESEDEENDTVLDSGF